MTGDYSAFKFLRRTCSLNGALRFTYPMKGEFLSYATISSCNTTVATLMIRCRRSFCYFTVRFLTFKTTQQKNKLGKIIILYDEDERLAPAAATTFVQREVDNVFMLSGGEMSILYFC